jgi:hypothetical protein
VLQQRTRRDSKSARCLTEGACLTGELSVLVMLAAGLVPRTAVRARQATSTKVC